jgi:hypothetical protein
MKLTDGKIIITVRTFTITDIGIDTVLKNRTIVCLPVTPTLSGDTAGRYAFSSNSFRHL